MRSGSLIVYLQWVDVDFVVHQRLPQISLPRENNLGLLETSFLLHLHNDALPRGRLLAALAEKHLHAGV